MHENYICMLFLEKTDSKENKNWDEILKLSTNMIVFNTISLLPLVLLVDWPKNWSNFWNENLWCGGVQSQTGVKVIQSALPNFCGW